MFTGYEMKNAVLSLTLAVTVAGNAALAENASDQQRNEEEAAEFKADNTGRNVRDRNDYRKTADDQSSSKENTAALADIRKAIVDNNDLSVNARNVKVMVDDTSVTIRGPVNSKKEADTIVSVAWKYSSGRQLVNELEVVR